MDRSIRPSTDNGFSGLLRGYNVEPLDSVLNVQERYPVPYFRTWVCLSSDKSLFLCSEIFVILGHLSYSFVISHPLLRATHCHPSMPGVGFNVVSGSFSLRATANTKPRSAPPHSCLAESGIRTHGTVTRTTVVETAVCQMLTGGKMNSRGLRVPATI